MKTKYSKPIVLALFMLTVFSMGTTKAWAAEITENIKVSSDTKADVSWAITDKNKTTKVKLNVDDTINISLQNEVDGVYIIWDKAPLEYSVNVESEVVAKNSNDFLHDYVKLSKPQKDFAIKIGSDALICDIYFFDNGQLPDWVQTWQPPYDEADMLLIPTHADDEHLYFGGTMPYYAGEKGLKVQVAYLTNHRGEPYRQHELLNGLWEVGIRAYPIISEFPDMYSDSLEHAKTIYKQEDILVYQVELIRRFKPKVVVDHDINGEYGHGAHRLNTDTVMEAIEVSGDASKHKTSFDQYGAWDVPKTYLHLYSENTVLMNWDIPLENFGGKTAFDMAVSGFSKHSSQQEFFKVLQSGPYDCRKFGLYRSLVGADTGKNDFFENIDLSIKLEKETIIETPKIEEAPKEVVGDIINSSSAITELVDKKEDINYMLVALVAILAILVIVIITYNIKKRGRDN